MAVLHITIHERGLPDLGFPDTSTDDLAQEREVLEAAMRVRPTLKEVAFDVRHTWRLGTDGTSWDRHPLPLTGTLYGGGGMIRW